MNEEIGRRWVAALRSGDYKQGVGRLRAHRGDDGVKYCCLGVLTDLWVQDAGQHWTEEGVPSSQSGVYGGVWLSPEVQAWSGMSNESGRLSRCVYTAGRAAESLAEANDSTTFDFSAIADIIEYQFLGVGNV